MGKYLRHLLPSASTRDEDGSENGERSETDELNYPRKRKGVRMGGCEGRDEQSPVKEVNPIKVLSGI